MAGRVTARVKWWRGSWWVLAQGPGIRNASGRKARKLGPTEEDRAKAEKVAERLRQSDTSTARGVLAPLPTDQVLRDWLESHRATLKKSTRATTHSMVEVHLVPFFGDRDLRDISKDDLVTFATQKMSEGMSEMDMEKTLEQARETAKKEAAEMQNMEAVVAPDGTFHVTGLGKVKSVKGTWKQEGDKIVFTTTEEAGEKKDPPEVLNASYENGVIRVRPEADMPFDLVFRKK